MSICSYSINAAIQAAVTGTGNQSGTVGDVRYMADSPAGTVSGLKTATLTFGASATINLYDGSFLSPDGTTAVPLRTLLWFDLWLLPTAVLPGGSLVIGNAASNAHLLWFGAATHTWEVSVGGNPFMGSGTVGKVVDNTHKNVLITNPHGSLSATYLFRAVGLLT